MSQLAVAQFIDVLRYRLVTINFERFQKGAAGILDAKTFIQHKQWVGNGIDDTLQLNVAGAQKAVKVFHIHDEHPAL